MKILIVTNNDVGLYKFRKMLIGRLIQMGHRVYIALPKGELIPKLEQMGCHYIETSMDRRGMNPAKDFKLLMKYYRVISEVKPEFVITYTIKPNIYGGIAACIKKIPYAVNVTGLGTAFEKENFLKRIVVWMYKIACKQVRVVFFENEGNQRVFINEKIVKEECTCKLNGAGVDTEEYQLSEYPKDEKTVHFLFIGRIMKEKGVEELIEAFRHLEQEREIILDIVGPYEKEYEETIKQKLNSQRIRYHGFQEDVKPYIQNSHCLVLPSYHEGMANTLLEAGAMGRPLITSDIYGCREAVFENRNGLLVKPRDWKDLYEKMKLFLDMPYEMKKQMGIESWKFITKNFSKQGVVACTIEEIDKRLEKGKKIRD